MRHWPRRSSRPRTPATRPAVWSTSRDDVIFSEYDCQTFDGIIVNPIMEGGYILEPLRDRIVGRIAQKDIYDPVTGDQLVAQDQELSDDLANSIQEAVHRAVSRSAPSPFATDTTSAMGAATGP